MPGLLLRGQESGEVASWSLAAEFAVVSVTSLSTLSCSTLARTTRTHEANSARSRRRSASEQPRMNGWLCAREVV